MLVEVGKKCHQCQWFGSYTRSCSYCLMNKKSRLRDENGNKIDPKYCDKYLEGSPRYDFSDWGKEGRVRKHE